MEFIAGVVAGMAALVWWEILILAIIGITFVGGTAFDRYNKTSAAIWLALAALFFVIGFKLGISAMFAMLASAAFWSAVGWYLGFGLVYSWLIEFQFAVRRAKNYYAASWEDHLVERPWLKEFLTKHQTKEGVDADELDAANKDINAFVTFNRRSYDVIVVEASKTGMRPELKINRGALVNNITAWTFFWPFYAISLVVGDLIKMVVETVVDLMSNLSNRYVKWVSINTFKV